MTSGVDRWIARDVGIETEKYQVFGGTYGCDRLGLGLGRGKGQASDYINGGQA